MKASMMATALTFLLNIVIGICAALMFGNELKRDFLENLTEMSEGASVVMCIGFCLVLMLHIPYLFINTKECMLVMH